MTQIPMKYLETIISYYKIKGHKTLLYERIIFTYDASFRYYTNESNIYLNTIYIKIFIK